MENLITSLVQFQFLVSMALLFFGVSMVVGFHTHRREVDYKELKQLRVDYEAAKIEIEALKAANKRTEENIENVIQRKNHIFDMYKESVEEKRSLDKTIEDLQRKIKQLEG